MQDTISRQNDPIVQRFEKDGLIQTYQKRISDLEAYIKNLEQSNRDL